MVEQLEKIVGKLMTKEGKDRATLLLVKKGVREPSLVRRALCLMNQSPSFDDFPFVEDAGGSYAMIQYGGESSWIAEKIRRLLKNGLRQEASNLIRHYRSSHETEIKLGHIGPIEELADAYVAIGDKKEAAKLYDNILKVERLERRTRIEILEKRVKVAEPGIDRERFAEQAMSEANTFYSGTFTAEIALRLGYPLRAVDYLIHCDGPKNFFEAMTILKKGGKKWQKMQAEVYREGLKYLNQQGYWYKLGEFAELSGNLRDAAKFAEHSDCKRAVRLYKRFNPEKAVQICEKCGWYQEAASILRKQKQYDGARVYEVLAGFQSAPQ